MERYTLQGRIEIINIHYKNGENLSETFRETRTFLGNHNEEIGRKIQDVRNLGDVKDKTRACRSRTDENITAV